MPIEPDFMEEDYEQKSGAEADPSILITSHELGPSKDTDT